MALGGAAGGETRRKADSGVSMDRSHPGMLTLMGDAGAVGGYPGSHRRCRGGKRGVQ